MIAKCKFCQAEFVPKQGASEDYCPVHCPTVPGHSKKRGNPVVGLISLLVLGFIGYQIYSCSSTVTGSGFSKAEKDRTDGRDFKENVETQLRLLVRHVLRDQDSAHINETTLYVSNLGADGLSGGYTLCGTVNAKNGFGGYVGDTRFVSTIYAKNEVGKPTYYANQVFFDEEDSGAYAAAYARLCHNTTASSSVPPPQDSARKVCFTQDEQDSAKIAFAKLTEPTDGEPLANVKESDG
jgi:hypothetical protein